MFLTLCNKLSTIVIGCLFCFIFTASSFPGSLIYKYDDLNRLEQVEYEDGTVIKYSYDEVGNRLGHMQFNRNSTSLPAGNVSIDGGYEFTRSLVVKLSLLCAAATGDCASMQFSNDKITWSPLESYRSGKEWSLPAGDGVKTVYVTFKDGSGKESSVVSDTILLDKNPTVTSAPGGGVFNTQLTVNLACNDGSGSGCDKIYYTIDGAIPTTASNLYSTPLVLSATTTLKYFAVDLAGNLETVKTVLYKRGGVDLNNREDTDLDGLSDSWEFTYGFDPNKQDSNNNGIADGKEDPDGDGLSNLNEYRFGTSPLKSDSDGDGISDYKEYVSNAMVPIINYLLL